MKIEKERRAKPSPAPSGPKCPFCGRRVSVRRIEEGLYHCDHCQKMFQA
ncbi:MAG TPA: transposase [Thermoanaerobaculia bacterium]|nr:transposase [Thermoanaerobaculia bacterium]